jgi:hypothetical protein
MAVLEEGELTGTLERLGLTRFVVELKVVCYDPRTERTVCGCSSVDTADS